MAFAVSASKYSWIPGRALPYAKENYGPHRSTPWNNRSRFKHISNDRVLDSRLNFSEEGERKGDEGKRERNRGKFGVNIYQTFIDWARRKGGGRKSISPVGESSLLCYSWKRIAVQKWRISGCSSQGHPSYSKMQEKLIWNPLAFRYLSDPRIDAWFVAWLKLRPFFKTTVIQKSLETRYTRLNSSFFLFRQVTRPSYECFIYRTAEKRRTIPRDVFQGEGRENRRKRDFRRFWPQI